MADGPTWTDVVAVILGGVGAVTGIISLVKQSKTGERSANAAETSAGEATKARVAGERGADAAERSADEAAKATQAADRSAASAEDSAREARTITGVETSRYHREQGPAHVSVKFEWRPSTLGGGVWAVMTNNGASDLEAESHHVVGAAMPGTPTHLSLHPGVPAEVYIEQLNMQDELGQDATDPQFLKEFQTWGPNAQRHVMGVLRDELEAHDQRFGILVVNFRSAEPCPCDRTPPSTDYGHWERLYPIDRIEI